MKMFQEELQRILCDHTKWLKSDGSDGKIANLEGADLRGANFKGFDLMGADLENANLQGADLENANLKGADLVGSYLHNANLHNANLHNANLADSNLDGANLQGANLENADLPHANLVQADLRGANLFNADLRGANLSDIVYNETTSYFTQCCPDKGSFIGYKIVKNYIVKLLIPEDAKRSSATTRKCRCNKATVLSITNIDGSDACVTSLSSNYDRNFIYEIGKTVEVPDFNENRWNECSPGIHFFITREEAVKY